MSHPFSPPCVRVPIALGERSYDVVIGSGLLDDPSLLAPLRGATSALVVTNTTVAPLYAARLVASLRTRFAQVGVVELPDGEAHKTWASMEAIFDALLGAEADRKTVVVSLGGGVVGDMAGFAAACFMRGVAFVQVATTLLAQVDSSVGGKTGINLAQGKNLVGAFHQPCLVLADLDTLDTLPQRELVAGLAEVIKYGVATDAAFFEWIEANLDRLLQRDKRALAHAVQRSCELKAAIVGADEREAGARAILNFGHTFGHAIEAGAGYGAWLHGEAVGCGMVLAADLSVRRGSIGPAVAERVEALVARAGLPVTLDLAPRRMVELMRHDKKSEQGVPRFVLLDALGSAHVGEVSERLVMEVLESHLGAPARSRAPVSPARTLAG